MQKCKVQSTQGDNMDRKLEINGLQYVRQSADFENQKTKVLNLLGENMLAALSQNNAIIAGGAILSTFTHQDVSDVDVYFKNREELTNAFVSAVKDWQALYLGHTDKSITLKDKETDTIVQFIYFDFFESAEKVFEAFDFTVCMAAIELSDDIDNKHELILHPSFLSDVASRTLRFNKGTRFPYVSLVRTKKYGERGYKIGKGNFIAIGLACAKYPITNWEEAKHQLGGVYGNQIELEIDEMTPFSEEKLFELVTSLKEYPLHKAGISDFDKIYLTLTGKKYDGDYSGF